MADKKYIDVEALIAKHACTKFDENDYIDVDDIRNFPTADVVEVVRCKDCKYRSENCVDGYIYYCEAVEILVTNEQFCSYAERKEKDNG
jgi:hypothetical protein